MKDFLRTWLAAAIAGTILAMLFAMLIWALFETLWFFDGFTKAWELVLAWAVLIVSGSLLHAVLESNKGE